jgi:hypothetical protein
MHPSQSLTNSRQSGGGGAEIGSSVMLGRPAWLLLLRAALPAACCCLPACLWRLAGHTALQYTTRTAVLVVRPPAVAVPGGGWELVGHPESPSAECRPIGQSTGMYQDLWLKLANSKEPIQKSHNQSHAE